MKNINKIIPNLFSLFKGFFLSISLIFFAALLRIWPLGILENKVPWLTFYPAVMVSAIYGGLFGGLIAAIFASGGKIWARTEEHKGSIFYFTLGRNFQQDRYSLQPISRSF